MHRHGRELFNRSKQLRYPPADKQYIFNFFYEVHIEGGSVCFLFAALGCLR